MKKQYFPIIVQRDGRVIAAKLMSSRSKTFSDKFCWTLEEAESVIEEVTAKLNNKKPTTIKCGDFGITSEHCVENEVVHSYIKVREVTEWEVLV